MANATYNPSAPAAPANQTKGKKMTNAISYEIKPGTRYSFDGEPIRTTRTNYPTWKELTKHLIRDETGRLRRNRK